MGGAADFSRLFLLLYLSDLKHLAKYGSLISGDTYIAMKYGPVPFHILSIYKQLKEHSTEKNEQGKQKLPIGINDAQQAIALAPYDKDYLAASEVECMFETLQQYKSVTTEALCIHTMGQAWKGADINGEIKLEDMAEESGATPEMIEYIKICYNNELISFNDAHENLH